MGAPSVVVCGSVECDEPLPPRAGRGRPRVYCSRECNDAARNRRRSAAAAERRAGRTCGHCAEPIPEARSGKARFCSDEHSVAFHNAKRVAVGRAERVATRGPCPECGDPVPDALRANAVFCSRVCMQRNVRARNYDGDAAREYNRAYLYGLEPGEFDARLEAQDGVCAICKRAPWLTDDSRSAAPHFDHDHTDGRHRGILCGDCNLGLGKFGDDPARLRAAADYVEEGV